MTSEPGERTAADQGPALEVAVEGRVVGRGGGSPDSRPGPVASSSSGSDAVRFPICVEGFEGSLEQLVMLAQRGEVDLATIPVSEITTAYRNRLTSHGVGPEPREVADFLALCSRLLALKAQRLLPDGPLDLADAEASPTEIDDPGARLAEYRLFKAAAEALLAPVSDEGVRSFLGLVSAEVVPTERLAIAPERLAAAFRAVLSRLPEVEPFTVETVTWSVEAKAAELRALLAARGQVDFGDIFGGVGSRLEAVALFLALLEVVREGDAQVRQRGPFGAITVSAVG